MPVTPNKNIGTKTPMSNIVINGFIKHITNIKSVKLAKNAINNTLILPFINISFKLLN